MIYNYANCCNLFMIMASAFMPSVIMPSVIMLNVVAPPVFVWVKTKETLPFSESLQKFQIWLANNNLIQLHKTFTQVIYGCRKVSINTGQVGKDQCFNTFPRVEQLKDVSLG